MEAHVRAISTELARRGHDVSVLTCRYSKALPVEERLDGVRILRSWTPVVALDTPLDFGTTRAMRSIDADIVHLHYPPPLTSYFAVRGLGRRPIPVCLTYHCDLYRPGPAGRILTSIYESRFLPKVLAAPAGSSSTPAATGRPRHRCGAARSRSSRRRSTSTGSGPTSTGARSDASCTSRTAGCSPSPVGSSPTRASTSSSGPSSPFRRTWRSSSWAGDPDSKASSSSPGGSASSERVRFCSSVRDAELPGYLRAADLFVFPSQNRLEGFGLAVAEAMACGLPVLTSDMPGVREVIEPGVEGLLIEPMIASDLVARITELLDDPPRRARMGAAARVRAERLYGVTTVVDAILRVYRDLLSSP